MILFNSSENTNSGLISAPAWIKFIICMSLSISAFGARSPLLLFTLIFLEIIVMLAFRGIPAAWVKEARVFLIQTMTITLLYLFRYGFPEGIVPGFSISIQLFLAFFPAIIFIESTPQWQISKLFSRFLSENLNFILTTCLNFIPMIINEIRDIYEVQLLRGANIHPKDLIKPWNWKELISCVVVPAILRCMVITGEIAVSAEARGFGRRKTRTHWHGEQ